MNVSARGNSTRMPLITPTFARSVALCLDPQRAKCESRITTTIPRLIPIVVVLEGVITGRMTLWELSVYRGSSSVLTEYFRRMSGPRAHLLGDRLHEIVMKVPIRRTDLPNALKERRSSADITTCCLGKEFHIKGDKCLIHRTFGSELQLSP